MYRNASSFEALEVDGKYGPKTEAAVKMFQQWYHDNRDSNMLVDGVFGTQTYDAFEAFGYTAGL
jgi:peptidoglycan hydrolase-like protein with peptidoglycan-binding domain